MIRFRLKELIADKEFREDRRVTLDEIAREAGVHRTTLSKISNQRGHKTSTEVLDRLCSYFQVPLEELAQHIDDRENPP